MAVKSPVPFKTYYDTLAGIENHATNEGAVRVAFHNLLAEWAKPQGLTLVAEQTVEGNRKRPIRPDGVLVDSLKLRRGYWEAKDSADSLEAEIGKKTAAGYPRIRPTCATTTG